MNNTFVSFFPITRISEAVNHFAPNKSALWWIFFRGTLSPVEHPHKNKHYSLRIADENNTVLYSSRKFSTLVFVLMTHCKIPLLLNLVLPNYKIGDRIPKIGVRFLVLKDWPSPNFEFLYLFAFLYPFINAALTVSFFK